MAEPRPEPQVARWWWRQSEGGQALAGGGGVGADSPKFVGPGATEEGRAKPLLPSLLAAGQASPYRVLPGEADLQFSPREDPGSPAPSAFWRSLTRMLTKSHSFPAGFHARTASRVRREGNSDILADQKAQDDRRLDHEQLKKCRQRLRDCVGQRAADLTFDVNEVFEKVVLYKNHALTQSCLLHLAVATGAKAANKRNGAQLVQKVLDCKADVRAKARYANPNGTQTEFEAIHMAAGLGSRQILEVLLKCAVFAQPADPDMLPGELGADYVSTWASIIADEAGESSGNRGITERQTYQPIHDAAFGRQKDNMLWLVQHGADPSSRNSHGFTPLHFVAMIGVGTDSATEVEGFVRKLLECDKSSLEATVEETHHERNLRGKIPLELAATGSSQFPKDCMHVLAPSLSDTSSTEPRFFQDLILLAKSNTRHAASALAQKICENTNGEDGYFWKSRVRLEAQDACSSTLAALFFMVPNAAADMVDTLLAKPLVQDPQKHPIPSRASLRAPHGLCLGKTQPMVCSYQADADMHQDVLRPQWKFNAEKTERDQPEIKWHRALVHEGSGGSELSRREDVFPVATKVVLWPNILDLDVCRALVCTAPEDDIIFARLPVQAICYWFWNNLGFPAFAVMWFFRLCELFALVQWGVGNEGHSSQSQPVCWAFLSAGIIREFFNLVWCFKEYCSRYMEHRQAESVLRLMWTPFSFLQENTVDMICLALRMWLMLDEQHVGCDEMTDFGQALIAVNVMFGFFRLMYMMRMLDKMGTGILAILETFFSGTIQQMLLICVMVFGNFFLAFIMLARTPDLHSSLEVFLQLYRGFLFGDGEALDYLGLDEEGPYSYAHIPLGPIVNFKMNLNRALSLVGTLFFSVIILNLIIAIYGSEYEKKKRVSGLLFLKQRLRMSCDCVLSHRKMVGPAPLWLSAILLPAALAAAGDLLFHEPMLPGLRGLGQRSRLALAAWVVAFAQTVLQIVVLQGFGQQDGVHNHHHDTPRFLWICHRSDFKSSRAYEPKDVKKKDLDNLAEEVNHKISLVETKVERLGQRLDAKLDRLLHALEKPSGSVRGSCESIATSQASR